MPTQAERRAATRGALVKAATQLFARKGFAATTVDDLAAAAGVAKGGFYHHFPSKEVLFAEVLDAQQAALAAEVLQAAAGASVLDGLTRGCRAFLTACTRPAVRRIVLLDGPAVIGWEAWREIDARHFGSLLRQALEAWVAEGVLPPDHVEPMVSLLAGAITEAAMVCARASDPKASVRAQMPALERLLGVLARGRS